MVGDLLKTLFLQRTQIFGQFSKKHVWGPPLKGPFIAANFGIGSIKMLISRARRGISLIMGRFNFPGTKPNIFGHDHIRPPGRGNTDIPRLRLPTRRGAGVIDPPFSLWGMLRSYSKKIRAQRPVVARTPADWAHLIATQNCR